MEPRRQASGTASSHLPYDTKPGAVVLSADITGGLVGPEAVVNKVVVTRIYGDGKVVFVDPRAEDREICEGKLSEAAITRLFEVLDMNGFWGLEPSYTSPGPAELPSSVIVASRYGQPARRVSCHGGALSAPPSFLACFEWLVYPALQPAGVVRYQRHPMSRMELKVGWYYGLEYQKKLGTPLDWIWVDAARSSRWQDPGELLVQGSSEWYLETGYLEPPLSGAHLVRIGRSRSLGPATVAVQFDTNEIVLDEFGDLVGATRKLCPKHDAKLALVASKDGEDLYDMKLASHDGPGLRLVLFPQPTLPYRAARLLTLNQHGAVERVIELHGVADLAR